MHNIVICGQSIFLLALESALLEVSSSKVTRLHSHLPSVIEHITALHPLVVFIERADEQKDLAWTLLSQEIPLVEIDIKTGRSTLLTGRTISLLDQRDFDALIAQLTAVASEADYASPFADYASPFADCASSFVEEA